MCVCVTPHSGVCDPSWWCVHVWPLMVVCMTPHGDVCATDGDVCDPWWWCVWPIMVVYVTPYSDVCDPWWWCVWPLMVVCGTHHGGVWDPSWWCVWPLMVVCVTLACAYRLPSQAGRGIKESAERLYPALESCSDVGKGLCSIQLMQLERPLSLMFILQPWPNSHWSVLPTLWNCSICLPPNSCQDVCCCAFFLFFFLNSERIDLSLSFFFICFRRFNHICEQTRTWTTSTLRVFAAYAILLSTYTHQSIDACVTNVTVRWLSTDKERERFAKCLVSLSYLPVRVSVLCECEVSFECNDWLTDTRTHWRH